MDQCKQRIDSELHRGTLIMELYRITEDIRYHNKYYVSGAHKWTLPGVDCSHCGARGSIWGVAYPFLETPFFEAIPDYREYSVVSFEKFDQLRAPIQRWHPDLWLPPGAKFGEFIGAAQGVIGDVVWQFANIFMADETFDKLLWENMPLLVGGEAGIKAYRRKAKLVELEILPGAELRDDLAPDWLKRCRYCEFYAVTIEKRIVLKKDSVPWNQHIFRLRQAPRVVVCTEIFKAAVEKLKLRNMIFSEVTTE